MRYIGKVTVYPLSSVLDHFIVLFYFAGTLAGVPAMGASGCPTGMLGGGIP